MKKKFLQRFSIFNFSTKKTKKREEKKRKKKKEELNLFLIITPLLMSLTTQDIFTLIFLFSTFCS